jgi:hypothetical protein
LHSHNVGIHTDTRSDTTGVRTVGAQSRVQQMRLRLQTKMPDIKKGLEMVTLLCDKQGSGEELKLDFELSDNLYAKAKVKDATAVNIWLGANVMLEYDINEVRFTPLCQCGLGWAQCRQVTANAYWGKWAGCLTRVLCLLMTGKGAFDAEPGQLREQLGEHTAGHDVPAQPNHHHRGFHRACLQLGCQAQTRS